MAASRPQLVANGVLYPERKTNHLGAAHAVLNRRRGWGANVVPIARWHRLVHVAQAADTKVVISAEVLCEANTANIERIVDDLGSRTRVLVTLRPLEQLIPSTWQQYVKSGKATPFVEWLEDVMRGPENATETPSFWRRNNHGAVVERWAKVVGTDRLGVMIVDSSRPRTIFDGFEDILGLPRTTLQPGSGRNRSMSAEEVEVVRVLNSAIPPNMRYRTYNTLVRRSIEEMLERREPGPSEHALRMPAWAVEQARRFGTEAVERIGATGVTVFGDLRALVPDTPIDDDIELVPPVMVPVDAAIVFLDSMLTKLKTDVEATIRPVQVAEPAAAIPRPGRTGPAAQVSPSKMTNRQLATSLLRDRRTPRRFAARIANKAHRERRRLAAAVRRMVERRPTASTREGG